MAEVLAGLGFLALALFASTRGVRRAGRLITRGLFLVR